MKKGLMMLGVAAIALASCTQNEVVEVAENRTIGFDAFVNNTTKADIVDAQFAKFWVFGAYDNTTSWTPFYTNDVVEKKESGWTAAKTAYWTANKSHKFAAYANGTSQLTEGVSFNAATGDNGTLKFENYTVGENDLVAAVATAMTWNNSEEPSPSKVGFTFKHLLSKVKFTFTTDAANDYVMKIEDLKIVAKGETKPILKAGCDFDGDNSDLRWTAASQGSTGEYTYATIDDCAGGTTNSAEEYVIPQNNALTVSFKVTFTDNGGTEIASKAGITGDLAISNETAWKAGNVYNYQVKINPEDVNKDLKKIEFDNISVGTWTNSTNQPGEIQETIPQTQP